MGWRATQRRIGGRFLAGAALALAGAAVCTPLSGASPAWAAAEPKPAPRAKVVVVASSASTAKPVWPFVDGAMTAMFLAPNAYDATGLAAPSYAGWLTEPPRGTPPDGHFVPRGRIKTEIELFQRSIAVLPLAPSDAAAAVVLIPVSIPLPPKRLAEPRAITLASFAPLPPRRLTEQTPEIAPALAALEQASPQAVEPPGATPDAEDAAAPTGDAARTIDDTPEPVEPPATPGRLTADRGPPKIEALIERYAARYDVPARLLRRVVWRESKFNPGLRHGPYWGLMQIRVDTARALGFRGAPSDLLDANINMTYAAAYLANAYRVAGRDEKRAVMLYAGGYYYEAKRKGMLGSLIRVATAE